jgi:hypothetical protein
VRRLRDPDSRRRDPSRVNILWKVAVFSGDRVSPDLSPRPANGSQFQPTPANSPAPVRFCDFRNLRGKTKKPRTEGSVLANRRLQPLGHLTAQTASIRRAKSCEIAVAPPMPHMTHVSGFSAEACHRLLAQVSRFKGVRRQVFWDRFSSTGDSFGDSASICIHTTCSIRPGLARSSNAATN